MIKLNKKQKKLLVIYTFIIFAVILVLFLNYLFNGKNVDKKYVGRWTIGYKFYDKETKKLSYTFTQTLTINKDGTFSTEEKTEPDKKLKTNIVNGEFKTNDNIIVLTYNQLSKDKEDTLYYQNGKLCTNIGCSRYYTKDSKTVYFDIKSEK